ncbi:E3 ubiquitin-protein ligase E3D [Sporothrix stenoceras]|uniref:E3 ubiquitin-protein ligase E3D n=1 Tax=Sporothrix stenoceras TaxID=5173 RepID=A0ABR3YN37_9PEZI
MTSSSPPFQLYAELLVNIRQVSVSASFQGPVDTKKTTAQVLPDGVTLRVSVDNGKQHAVTLTLPGQVAVGASGGQLPLQGPALASGYVAWRLPLAGQAGQDDSDLAPWSAPDLQPGSSVSCRGCNTSLVPSGRIHTWKDLPSDNWAEMMEFWHCHKPDVKKADTNGKSVGDEKGLADRGYGANSIISAEAGVGFVDLTTLLFSESDCQGLLFSDSTADKASPSLDTILESVQKAVTGAAVAAAAAPNTLTAPRGLNIFCASCRAQIGYFTLRRQQSVHLFKWQVDLRLGQTSAPEKVQAKPTIADCVAATLVATIQRTGSSKSLVLPIYELEELSSEESAEKVLQVWVLNSNIVYSASGRLTDSSSQRPARAIKLLYKYIPRKEADAILDNLNSDVQEINLPRETIGAVTELLGTSTQLLPARDRNFKGWKIGLLERWDPTRL